MTSRALRSSPAVLLVLSSALGACSSPSEAGGPSGESAASTGRTAQAVIDGVASDAEDDSAIRLRIFENGEPYASCTGVLVAENLVLTARHCVSTTSPQFLCDETGTAVRGAQVLEDRAASDLGVITGSKTSEKLAAKGVKLFTLSDETICNRDIALVLLDKPVTGVPIAQLRLKAPPALGETVRVVGWGISNTVTNSPRIRARRDDVPITNLGPLTVFPETKQGIGDHEILVGESVCTGDSGGPAYDETTHAVIGVYSQGGNGKTPDAKGSQCVDDDTHVTQNVYTRVDGFPDLIAAAFAAAGTQPWEEGGVDPRTLPSPSPSGDGATPGDGAASPGDDGATASQPAAAPAASGCAVGPRPRSSTAPTSILLAACAALLAIARRRATRER